MSYNSKYTGEQVEGFLDQIANGEISGGSSVYKWNWNSEMNGTFTEEEFENLSNADVVYITTGVSDMEMLYSVDGRVVVEDALHLGIHILSFETDTDNSEAAYVESITFIFDNASKTWSAQGGNSELITNEQLTSALEDKQDKITDLNAIRSGAEKGATALQSVPSEYVTESELVWVKEDGEAGVRLKGTNGTATGNSAISAGDDKTASDGTPFPSVASGDHAVAFGFGNTCAGRSTLAQGLYNIVNGKDSVAFGQRNLVNGDQAFAAGQQNEVTTRLGVAIGYKNKATNTDSIAIGYQNTSGGSASVAMGDTCEANGTSATAMGYKTKATGAYSSTFGGNTQATNEGEVAMGVYNKSTTSTDTSEQTAFSFGIGTSDTNRANAFEIKKNGEVYIGDKKLSGFATTTELDGKQDTLVSGTNIKTINGQSVLGGGNITIEGGDGGVTPYITDFTVSNIRSAAYEEGYRFQFDNEALEEALRNRVPVYVPIDQDATYEGYGVLQGFAEDLLYFTVTTYAESYSVEVTRSYNEIDSTNITHKGFLLTNESGVCKQQVGDLIAAETKALYDGNSVYALPTSANGDEDDILVSKNSLKTVNGQSLIGSGDISISGGGSSSGKEYVEAPLMTEPMGTSIMFTSSVPLEPNKVYVANKKVSSIDMSRILIPSDSIGAEYTIMFQTSTSELPISVSNMVQLLWADGATPTIEADTYYELSLVVNRMGNTYDTIIFKVVLTPFKAVEQ